MKKSLMAIVLATATLGTVLPASAAVQNVRFARGADSATYQGKVRGYGYNSYYFTAKAGQVLNVDVAGGHAEAVLYGYDDFVSGSPYTLPATKRYEVRVLQPRSFARQNTTSNYRVGISIRNAGNTAAVAPARTEHETNQEVSNNHGVSRAVQFARGAHAASYTGRVRGYNYDTYYFTARAGQVLNAKVNGTNVEAALYGYDDFDSGSPYVLPESKRYELRVLQPRAAARNNVTRNYRVTIDIQNRH